jgi:hypothetical protein
MVVEPVGVGVVAPPVVPDPQATRIANNMGMPIVKAKIRDQLLLIMSQPPYSITKYKPITFREGPAW